MLISCGAPNAGAWATPELLTRFARRAEELGYHGLWTFQRLMLGEHEQLNRGPVYRSVLDPLLTLTWAAAHTRSIRLGVAIINMPYVSPAYLAKQATTLDVLSQGRLDLGLGTGWSAVEFASTGSDPNPRGPRTREYLAALKALWTDDVSAYEGTFYQIPPSVMRPRPVQAGGPPILLGGGAETALRRAGRIADGWVSRSAATLEDVRRGARVVRAAAAEAGRDPDSLRIVVRGVVRAGDHDPDLPLSGSWEQIKDGSRQYAEAGATELFYDLNWDPRIGSPDADPAEAAERAEEILSALAPDPVDRAQSIDGN